MRSKGWLHDDKASISLSPDTSGVVQKRVHAVSKVLIRRQLDGVFAISPIKDPGRPCPPEACSSHPYMTRGPRWHYGRCGSTYNQKPQMTVNFFGQSVRQSSPSWKTSLHDLNRVREEVIIVVTFSAVYSKILLGNLLRLHAGPLLRAVADTTVVLRGLIRKRVRQRARPSCSASGCDPPSGPCLTARR